MKCELHRLKETKTMTMAITAMDEELANQGCERLLKALEKCISKDWKYRVVAQTSGPALSEIYYYEITFDLSSKDIDKTIVIPELPEV